MANEIQTIADNTAGGQEVYAGHALLVLIQLVMSAGAPMASFNVEPSDRDDFPQVGLREISKALADMDSVCWEEPTRKASIENLRKIVHEYNAEGGESIHVRAELGVRILLTR